ncbi:MAG: polymorphic toxin-type HINT domain-containing protein [Planctomycetota bacterium]
MMGADMSSAAYTAGNIVGNVAGGMAAGMVTGGVASCGAVSRVVSAGAKLMRVAEKVAEVKDGIQTAIDLVKAIRCGDPMAIAGAAFGAAMTAAPHLGSAAGKKFDVSPCGKRKCFVAGTPVWVLKDGCDPDKANAALAAAESKAKASGDRSILQRAIDKWTTTKPIETVTAADYALSRDESGPENPLVVSPVTELFRNTTEAVIWLTIRDTGDSTCETIGTTPTHPFWVHSTNGDLVPEADVSKPHLSGLPARHRTTPRGDLAHITRGWVHAQDLKAGYVLAAADGRQLVVVDARADQSHRHTYNFDVAVGHTYHVGCTATWCHNNNAAQRYATQAVNAHAGSGLHGQVNLAISSFQPNADSSQFVKLAATQRSLGNNPSFANEMGKTEMQKVQDSLRANAPGTKLLQDYDPSFWERDVASHPPRINGLNNPEAHGERRLQRYMEEVRPGSSSGRPVGSSNVICLDCGGPRPGGSSHPVSVHPDDYRAGTYNLCDE